MSNKINDGGPAFPVAMEDWRDIPGHPAPGMSLRAYAAIQLRVPNSGEPWLDEMIEQSRRDWFAGQAVASFIKVDTAYDYTTGHCDPALARRAGSVADALITALAEQPEEHGKNN